MLALDPMAPYLRLVELAETECALAEAGHLEELDQLQLEWQELQLALPTTPPPAAKEALQRALALSRQAAQILITARAALSVELGNLGQSRALGRAYTPAAAGPVPRSIDTAA